MTHYPKSDDGYPVIYLHDTDQDLSSEVQIRNNTRYAFFKTIARGGKCIIQSCKDLHLSRSICFKTLRPEIANDPYEQKRFLREARVTAMLQHPNTPPVYELGRDANGHYYFTMKLVVGATLREILDQLRLANQPATETWDLERLIDILIQVSQALHFAHTHGVVHRDVKPENIVAGSFGEVLLLDWGLAKVWDKKSDQHLEQQPSQGVPEERDKSLTAQGPLQATPLYMSPEQISGSFALDHRTDIYSLGVVLFEILTLQPMAWGKTLEEILKHIQNSLPPAPSLVSPDREVPPTLETLCLRCVQKEPDHRLRSVHEVIQELLYWQRLRTASRPIA